MPDMIRIAFDDLLQEIEQVMRKGRYKEQIPRSSFSGAFRYCVAANIASYNTS